MSTTDDSIDRARDHAKPYTPPHLMRMGSALDLTMSTAGTDLEPMGPYGGSCNPPDCGCCYQCC